MAAGSPPPSSRRSRRVRSLAAVLLALLPFAPPPQLAAQGFRGQEVRGTVLDPDGGQSIEGAMVVLLDGSGRVLARGLTDAAGFFRVRAPEPGTYRLRVDRIGYGSAVGEPFEVAAGAVVVRTVRTAVRPVELRGLDVEGARRCEVRPAEGALTARVWEEARKALEAARWTTERELYRFAWMRFERTLGERGRRVLEERRIYRRHFVPQPFFGDDPAVLASRGFVRPEGEDFVYLAPDAVVLLSDAFLDTHCFGLEQRRRDGVREIGLRFQPIAGRRLSDVEGVLWLEEEGARLRSLEYRYVNLRLAVEVADAGGEVGFQDLPNGTWIVSDWRIRMPRIGGIPDDDGRITRHRLLGYREEGGAITRVAAADGSVVLEDRRGGTIMGTVVDSLGLPAPGISVWLAGTAFQAVTDAEGAFAFPGLGRGTWTLWTTAPVLDSVGYRGTAADVQVRRTATSTVRLELPSAQRAALERCRDDPPMAGEAVLVGRVVDARGDPVDDARVRALWRSYDGEQGARGVRRAGDPRPASLPAASTVTFAELEAGLERDTNDDGVFWFCTVPAGERVQLGASRDDVSSGVAEIRVARDADVVTARIVLPDPPER